MSEPKPPTICNCGLAKSYHPRLADHEYVPRYEPNAWHDGYQRALHDMAEAASPAALDVGEVGLAVEQDCRDHRIEGVSPFCPNCGRTA